MEKLKRRGAKSLSNAELISAAAGIDDTETAYTLLQRTNGGIKDIAEMATHDLQKSGLTQKQAEKLRMAFEIGSRLNEAAIYEETVGDPMSVYYSSREIWNAKQEHIMILSLNIRNGIIAKDTVSIGTISSTLAEPRDIIRPALMRGAQSIILVHNHPSGHTTPSQADIDVTKRIIAAAELFDMPVKEHMVVSAAGYTSMLELLGADFFKISAFSIADKINAVQKLNLASEAEEALLSPVPYTPAPEETAVDSRFTQEKEEEVER
jgi:DNA repair protein RadC